MSKGILNIKNEVWFFHKEDAKTFVVSDHLGQSLLSSDADLSEHFPEHMEDVVRLASAAPALFRNLASMIAECESNGISNDAVSSAKNLLNSLNFEKLPETEPAKPAKPSLTDKQKFLEYFRSEAYDQEVSVDEKVEIFLQSLQGSSDITYDLLEQLCSSYNVNLKEIVN